MTAKSWNHKVGAKEGPADMTDFHGHAWKCEKCKSAPAAFRCSFDYVSSKRTGRVTDRMVCLCGNCAAAWAIKHGAQMPAAPSDGRFAHATD